MKIRMKKNHSVIQDVEPRSSFFESMVWESTSRCKGTITFYSSEVWEPVPLEQWEPANVTVHNNGKFSISRRYVAGVSTFFIPSGVRVVDLGDGTVRFEERVS